MDDAPARNERFQWVTRGYERGLEIAFALVPSLGIAYIELFQDRGLRFISHGFHEFAIALAIALSAFVTYVTWRCYQSSGEVFLRWLTLGFLGFTLIYAPHGALTRTSECVTPMLFLLFGPVSRLFLAACLILGLLRYGEPAEARRSANWWLGWVAGLLAVDVAVGIVAITEAATHPVLRIVLEGAAMALVAAGIAIMLARRIRGPLMAIYTISLAAFGQSSVSFLLAQPWSHQWWMGHTIFAAGFFLLSYGVVQAFHTTRAFSTVFSQEELMRRLEDANAELLRLATTDPLTDVANRRHFLEQLAAEVRRRARGGEDLSLLSLDLDYFKSVNDTYGHQAGDEVLKAFAGVMKREARAVDTVGRMGGEEFMILMPATDGAAARVAAERIRQSVAALAIAAGGQTLKATVSIGVARFGPDGETAEAVFAAADRRLYEAKSGGRNRVVGPSP